MRRSSQTGAGAEADEGRDEPYESFKIISKKALSDYYRAEERFMDFLMQADVWSEEQVTATIIDFHLVEKCRTKFRAFVKSFGARVKFETVPGAPRKQEYHGTVTVSRACKQQFLTNHPQAMRAAGQSDSRYDGSGKLVELKLQCAAPVPITTGAYHVPYVEDGCEAPRFSAPPQDLGQAGVLPTSFGTSSKRLQSSRSITVGTDGMLSHAASAPFHGGLAWDSGALPGDTEDAPLAKTALAAWMEPSTSMMSDRAGSRVDASPSLGLASRVSGFSAFSHNVPSTADFSRSFLSASGSIMRPDDSAPFVKSRRLSLLGCNEGADDSRFHSDTGASGDVGAALSHEMGRDVSPPAPRHHFTSAAAASFLTEAGSAQSDANLARRMTIAGAMPPRPGTAAPKRNVSDTGLPPWRINETAELDGLKLLLDESELDMTHNWRDNGDDEARSRSRPVTVKRHVPSVHSLGQMGRPPGPLPKHEPRANLDASDAVALPSLGHPCMGHHLTEAEEGLRDVDEFLGPPPLASEFPEAPTSMLSARSARSAGGSTGGMSWRVPRSGDHGRSADFAGDTAQDIFSPDTVDFRIMDTPPDVLYQA